MSIMRPLFTLCAISLASISGAAWGQSASGQGSAVVVRPLSLVKTDDLRFGSLIAGASAGTVTISQTSGARGSTGGVTPATADPFGPAAFVSAGLSSVIAIVSVDTATTLTRAGGGATMAVTDIATDRPAVTLFPGSGVMTINVGGRLAVGANQMPGDYAGSFNLTVFYL
jgi:hypothetical protein